MPQLTQDTYQKVNSLEFFLNISLMTLNGQVSYLNHITRDISTVHKKQTVLRGYQYRVTIITLRFISNSLEIRYFLIQTLPCQFRLKNQSYFICGTGRYTPSKTFYQKKICYFKRVKEVSTKTDRRTRRTKLLGFLIRLRNHKKQKLLNFRL